MSGRGGKRNPFIWAKFLVEKAPANHSERLEEHEANNPSLNKEAESLVEEKQSFSVMCLLEIFFAKETQPVIANLDEVA